MCRRIGSRYLLVIALTFVSLSGLQAQEDWMKVLGLSGKWKFSIGDRKSSWLSPDYNDDHWETIRVPSNWEDEGFHGYDGYAWYRKQFDGNNLKKSASINYALYLGYIDDIDEVYLNGTKIGLTGSFPPNYNTAYNTFRNYFIPSDLINFDGNNTIAVRVYDPVGNGGITSGKVGIYGSREDKNMEINLQGRWDFKLTKDFDNVRHDQDEYFISFQPNLAKKEVNEAWEDILVPGHWENQGYRDYDGSAIYRKEFYLPEDLSGEDMVLVLGKIDDADKTYLNGKLIGSTNWYNSFRGYFIDAKDLNDCETNVIEVFVYDKTEWGGFSEGPIGLVKQSNYTRFIRWRK